MTSAGDTQFAGRALGFNDVSFAWEVGTEQETKALSKITFSLQRGEFVSIVGPSGCGKTTILKLAAGLVRPTAGVIHVDGSPLLGLAADTGFVFQQHSLFPWLSARKNVEFGMKMRGVTGGDRKKRAMEVLERVGLGEVGSKYPHQLSGGMQQRVAIARVLAYGCPFILMDEPFAALDYQTRYDMQGFLLSVWREFERTILFVTHQVEESIRLSDRILLMKSDPGCIVEDISVELERPRDITGEPFNHYRARIIEHLQAEARRAPAEAPANSP